MAFTVIRMGDQIRVNSTWQDYQGTPSIASLADGRWIVVWDGYGPNGRGFYQQAYNADGTPIFMQSGQPVERLIDLHPTGGLGSTASIEAFEDGWVVTWVGRAAGSDEDILIQRFDSNGNPLLMSNGQPAAVRVNQLSKGSQYNSQITTLEDGWLVTWTDTYNRGIYQQRYDANGQAQYRNDSHQIEERRVSAASTAIISGQDVAAIDGGAAVVWTQRANGNAPHEIILQILDADGDPTLDVDRVIAVAGTAYTDPEIQALPNGDGFLVVWASPDAYEQGVFFQKFNAQGDADFSAPLQVNTSEIGRQHQPSVEVLGDGGWIVTFSSGNDIFQRRYDSRGNPQGAEIPIAVSSGSEWDRDADVTHLGGGRWAVVWSDMGEDGMSSSDVAQRVFTLADVAILTPANETAVGTDEAEVLQVQAGGLSSGDSVDGGGKDDTLEMVEAGTLDLTAPILFNGFELIEGAGGEDIIVANAARLSGIKRINGGDDGGEDDNKDELRLYDGATPYDLSGVTIDGIERIALMASAATVTVGNAATGLLIHGEGHNDKVSLVGGESFSLRERYRLFKEGVETVQDASGTYVKAPNEILYLNGDLVTAPIGSTIRLDDGMDAEVPTTPPHYARLFVKIGNRIPSQDELTVSETDRVLFDDGGGIAVDGTWIGGVARNDRDGMEILLTSQATPERVQELIRALSYKNVATGTAVTGLRSVTVILEDAGGSVTSATVNVNVVNQGETIPPRVVLTGPDQVSGADTSLLSPFAAVRIRDADSDVTVTIRFAAEKGRLVLPPGNFGTYDPAAGTYTVTGDPFDITDYIRTIQFDPRDRSDIIGSVETTPFTISVTDDGVRSDSKTVHVYSEIANHAPGKPVLSGGSIKEMSDDGTVIGTVSATDQNLGDTVTLATIGVDDAPFQLVTQGGITQLVVTKGIKLDYEQRQAYTFTLRATDARGLSNDTVVTIEVQDVNPERTAGSSFDDVIKGGAGKDTLGGGLGNDKIFGGLGNDTLTGNKGRDIFVFNTKTSKKTNVDTIKDFSVKDDSIWLDNAVFTKVGKGSEGKPGNLAKSMFWKGKAAHDSSDRIVYDEATGALYYDADGTGRATQVTIATLKKGLALTEKGFFVI